MKRIFIAIILIVIFSQQLLAVDLFDLRIIPSSETNRLEIDGYISWHDYQKNGSFRRARWKSLYPKWIKKGKLEISLDNATYSCAIEKGYFSCEPLISSTTNIVNIYYHKKRLYTETAAFPPKFDYVIVSDVDDTILESSVGNFKKMIYKAMLKDVKERKAIPGTSTLYRKLNLEQAELGKPLFVYLTGSPSFLSRTVKAFLNYNLFPYGVHIFKKSFWSGNTANYKLKWLKKLAVKFNNKQFLLFGDSGQKDPFTYKSFVESNPKTVRGIIIHEVTNRLTRIQALQQIKKELSKKGIPFLIWNNIEDLRKQMRDTRLL